MIQCGVGQVKWRMTGIWWNYRIQEPLLFKTARFFLGVCSELTRDEPHCKSKRGSARQGGVYSKMKGVGFFFN